MPAPSHRASTSRRDERRAERTVRRSERRRLVTLLRTESVGGALLVGAAAIALVLANSPLAHAYATVRDWQLGPSALGVTVPSQWELQVNYKPQFGPTTAEFAKAFQDKFHAKADYHAASGYTCGVILQHAIEQANSIDPERDHPTNDHQRNCGRFGRKMCSTPYFC